MWPVIYGFLRTYAPYVTFPVAAVVGFIGYNFENIVGRNQTPWKQESIREERLDRKLDDMAPEEATDVPTLKSKKGIPRTVLDRNDVSKLKTKESDS